MGQTDAELSARSVDRAIDAFKTTIDDWAAREHARAGAVSIRSDTGSRAKIAIQAYDAGVAQSERVFDDEHEVHQSLTTQGGEEPADSLFEDMTTTVFIPYTLERFSISYLDWILAIADREGVPRAAVIRRFNKFGDKQITRRMSVSRQFG